jgi:hypothetical protein
LNAGLLNAGHILTLSRRPELRWILLQELGYRKFLEQVKQSYPRLIKIEDEDSGARLVRIKFRKSSVSGQASALFLTFKPGPQNEEYEPYPLAPDIGLATVKDALCWAFHLPRERNRALQPIVET